MTVEQLKRIGIVLVVALALWGVVEVVRRGGDAVEEAEILPAVTPAEVDTVTFVRPADTIRLVKDTGDSWRVNAYPASPDAVAELFRSLAEPTSGELAAQSSGSHVRMGVDDTSGKRMTVTRGGQTLADVLFGKQGRSYQSAYARRDGDSDVYLVSGALVPLVDRSLKDWRDKRIVTIEPERVARVVVERGRRRYALARHDSTWSFENGGRPDSAAVKKLIDAFSALEAQGTAFATPAQADSTDFRHPERRVTLFDSTGATMAAVAFDSTNGGFWVRRATGATIYRLYQWKVDELTPADSTLRSKAEGQ